MTEYSDDQHNQKKILILSANPINTTWKRLAKEVSEIEEGIKRSKFREQFRVISKWAVTMPKTLKNMG